MSTKGKKCFLKMWIMGWVQIACIVTNRMYHQTFAVTVRTRFICIHSRSFPNIRRIGTDQGPWPSSINRNLLEARQEIQARLYWGPCSSRGEQKQVKVSLARSPRRGAGWFPIWVGGWGVSRGWRREVT